MNTRYPFDPSGAKRLPDQSVTQTLEEAHASHCKTLPPQSTRAKTSTTNSPHTSRLCPVPQIPYSILSPAQGRESIQTHCFFRHYVQGDERTLLTDERAQGLIVRRNRLFLVIRKKKSLPCGPYFPDTFHSMDAVRTHTLSIGSK